MAETILAIDAGSTNVHALVVGADGSILGQAVAPYRLLYPKPGLVEQDAGELWQTTITAVKKALAAARLSSQDLAAVGITGQRASCVLWDRQTGQALGPILNWQDQRGIERARELTAGGFPMNPIASAARLESMIDSIPGGRAKLSRGELAWGTVDSYLAWKLSGGALHVTDCSHACTTGYYRFSAGDWNHRLIAYQGLDLSLFPSLVDTSGIMGLTDAGVFGAAVPISAIVGDQQSATFAQSCLVPGSGKVSYGTSATCNVHTGGYMVREGSADGLYPLVLWRLKGDFSYCLEGMVITAGAIFTWFARELGIIRDLEDASLLAAGVSDCGGVSFLPAFQGMGAPYRRPEQYGMITGLTSGATRAQIVRAAMEGISFRVREILERIYLNPEPLLALSYPALLRVDGGASSSDIFMQIQADILGIPVERMRPLEATAYGAALLAGEGCGLWQPGEAGSFRRTDRLFEPRWNPGMREQRFASWRRAISSLTATPSLQSG